MVSDEKRLSIVFDEKTGKWISYSDDSRKKRNLIIVLESPHKDEFDKNNKPIRPANGVTGFNIEKYLSTVITEEKIELDCICQDKNAGFGQLKM